MIVPTATPEFVGQAAGFGAWDVISAIVSRGVAAGAMPVTDPLLAVPGYIDLLVADVTGLKDAFNFFGGVARCCPGSTREQFQAMLRNLLMDRFKVQLHRERKEMEVYSLTVAKRGPKFKLHVETSPG